MIKFLITGTDSELLISPYHNCFDFRLNVKIEIFISRTAFSLHGQVSGQAQGRLLIFGRLQTFSSIGISSVSIISERPLNMFPKILKKLMIERGLSATELGALCGVPKSNIVSWLNGSNPKMSQLIKAASFLEVSLDYLITGKDTKLKADPTQIESISEVQRIDIDSAIIEIRIKTRK